MTAGKRTVTFVTALLLCVGVLVAGPGAEAARSDARPPRIRVVNPSSGGIAKETVRVRGRARGDAPITRVKVAVDGGRFRKAAGTTKWSLPLDTTQYPDGVHKVRVRAWDRQGRKRTVSVRVAFANATGAGAHSMTTPEGTRIEVDSAGPWTADQIHQMLVANGLDPTVGPSLTVKVQDTYGSQLNVSATSSGGTYTGFKATMYLKGVSSGFASRPHSTLAHEYGHAYTLYHLYLAQHGDWSSYLEARGLDGDPRLDTAYHWTTSEIVADDYRLLFGSDVAISERPTHLNADIPDPRQVARLRDFLAQDWRTP